MLDLERDMTALVERVRPSIVTILGEKPLRQAPSELGNAQRTPTRHVTVASGVILDASGHILTTENVARRARVFRVAIGQQEYPADVIAIDPVSQLSLLLVHGAPDLTPLPVATGDDLHVGSWVFIVGATSGTETRSSFGTVSALPRADDEPNRHFISMTATIAPGQVGGAVVDSHGALVGIALAEVVASEDEGDQTAAPGDRTKETMVPAGTTIAVPSDAIREVADLVRAHGTISRGFLGVRWSPDEEQGELPTTLPVGAHVWEVVGGSPAARAGIRKGDVITEFNKTHVDSGPSLRGLVMSASPGETVPVRLLRDGAEMSVNVIIGALPTEPER